MCLVSVNAGFTKNTAVNIISLLFIAITSACSAVKEHKAVTVACSSVLKWQLGIQQYQAKLSICLENGIESSHISNPMCS